MQADRHAAEHAPDRAGDHVVRRMLLHVVEAARPVDFAVHLRADRKRPVGQMQNVAVHDLHVQNACGIDRAGIERLTARGWVKRAAVEPHVEAVAHGRARNDPRVKFG